MPVNGGATPIHVVQMLEATDGGTRTHLLHIVRNLDRRMFRFTAIVSCNRNPSFRRDIEQLKKEGVDMVELPMVRRIAPARDLAALLTLRKLLRRLQPQIVHTHASKAGAIGRVAARMAGVSCILHTPHVFYFEGKRGIARKFYRALERILSRFCDKTILLTSGQAELFAREVRDRRFEVIANGVDTELFRPQSRSAAKAEFGLPNAPLVGIVTRFQPQKGGEVLLQALARLMSQMPDVFVVIVGDGPLRPQMIALSKRLGIFERCIWISHVDAMEKLYAAFDALALASRYEGMPYSLLEAMACGIPVAAGKISGCVEVIEDGVSGLLSRPDSHEELADNLRRILSDGMLSGKLAEGARARASQFPLSRFVSEMTSLYESCTGACEASNPLNGAKHSISAPHDVL